MTAAAKKKPGKRRIKQEPQQSPLHFLVVEADPVPAEQIRRGLLSYTDPYRLTVAASLADARTCISTDPPDLVLLDLRMPDGSGDELLPEQPRDFRFPAIAMVDDDNDEVISRIQARGISEYLIKTKPAFDNLPHTVAHALRNWKMWQSQRMLEWRLTTQESLVRAMMENPADSIALLDRKGTILDLNETLAKRIGRTRPAAIGTRVSEYLPDTLARSRKKQIDSVFNTGVVARFEDERDGRWYDNIIQPIRDPAGRILQVVIIARDITGLMRTEEALRESEEKYRLMLMNARDGIMVNELTKDGPGKFIEINDTACRILGMAREELRDLSLIDLDTKEMKKRAPSLVGEIRKKQHVVFSIRHRTKSGEEKDLDISVSLFMLGGKPTLLSIVRDITGQKTAELALRESEGKYRFLIENSRDVVWAATPDLKFTFLNQAVEQFSGYAPEELAGRPITDILTPASADNVRDRLKKSTAAILKNKTGSPSTFELEFTRKDGSTGQAEVSLSPLLDNKGKLAGFQGITRDITGRKRAEIALHESEERFRTLVETSPDMIWEIDPEGKFRYISPTVKTIMGYSPEEIAGKHILSLVAEEGKAQALQKIRDHTAGKNEGPFIVPARHRDGHELAIEIRSSRVTDRSGKIAGFRGVAQDITEYMNAQKSLRESEERYRTLVEELPDFVIVYRDGELLYVNAAVTRLLGTSADKLLHTNITTYIPEEMREIVRVAMEKRANGRPLLPYVVQIAVPGWPLRWVEIRGARIMFEGKPATLNVLTDITEKKWAEEALFASEQKFRTLADYTFDWEYWIGPDGTFIYVSPSCERITGYSPDEFYNNRDLLREIVLPEDRDLLVKHCIHNVTSPDSEMLEFRILTKRGDVAWLGHVCRPIFSPAGDYLGRRGSNRDITQRKLVEGALRESEERYRNLFNRSPVGTALTDPDGTILEMNNVLQEMFGFSRDEKGTLKMSTLYVNPEARKKVVDTILSKGSISDYEIMLRRHDGSTFPAVIHSSVITQGGKQLLQTSVLDITDRKMMEEEIRSLNRALEQRVIQRTNELNASLGEKEVLLREIHHRVKNNLQIIISILRLQNRHTTDPDTHAILLDSESRVRSMALVHEKLYRSTDLAHVDIGEYLQDLSRYLFNTYAINPSQVALRVEIKGVSLDINRAIPVGLILNELITNALKHAYPEGRRGEMLITGQEDDDGLVFFIHDNGIGMPEGFDWRHSPSLGMHLVTTLIEQVRGTIECTDCKSGTHFVIRIPRDSRTAIK